jgi:hypothetical protein
MNAPPLYLAFPLYMFIWALVLRDCETAIRNLSSHRQSG